jgi:hypothetical protein
MDKCCPTCGRPMEEQPPVERAGVVSGLKAFCREHGRAVFGNDHVDEVTAGKILNRSARTLRHWREKSRPIPFHRIGGPCGRVVYSLSDLAGYIMQTEET